MIVSRERLSLCKTPKFVWGGWLFLLSMIQFSYNFWRCIFLHKMMPAFSSVLTIKQRFLKIESLWWSMKQQYENIKAVIVQIEDEDILTLSHFFWGSGDVFDWGDLDFDEWTAIIAENGSGDRSLNVIFTLHEIFLVSIRYLQQRRNSFGVYINDNE